MTLVDCPNCDGKGEIMLYPFYAKPLPEKKPFVCEVCHGEGKLQVISRNYAVIFEDEI